MWVDIAKILPDSERALLLEAEQHNHIDNT